MMTVHLAQVLHMCHRCCKCCARHCALSSSTTTREEYSQAQYSNSYIFSITERPFAGAACQLEDKCSAYDCSMVLAAVFACGLSGMGGGDLEAACVAVADPMATQDPAMSAQIQTQLGCAAGPKSAGATAPEISFAVAVAAFVVNMLSGKAQ